MCVYGKIYVYVCVYYFLLSSLDKKICLFLKKKATHCSEYKQDAASGRRASGSWKSRNYF